MIDKPKKSDVNSLLGLQLQHTLSSPYDTSQSKPTE